MKTPNSTAIAAGGDGEQPVGEGSVRLMAPFFRYEYSEDFPKLEQLSIEAARLEANRQIENKTVSCYEDYSAAHDDWFWHLASTAAAAIGRAGARCHWSANRRRELFSHFGLKAAQAADLAGRDAQRFERLCESPRWRALDDVLWPPKRNQERSKIGKKLGRRGNPERRAAIRDAITKHGDSWRDHLSEILEELDSRMTPLGSFGRQRIDLGDGKSQQAVKWEDLDLAVGDERGKVIDALRKYR